MVSCPRGWSVAGIVVAVTLASCERSERAPSPEIETPAESKSSPSEPETPQPATPLADVWGDAIPDAPDADGVYVVDSFVAAWLFARASAGSAYEWELQSPDGGYRLTEIPPGTPYARLGLRAGDVIETFNGVVLTGPDRFGFALDGAESLVILSVLRDGDATRRQFQLRPGAAWMRQLADYAGDPDPTVVADASEFDDAPVGVVEADAPSAKPESKPTRSRGTSRTPRPKSTPSPSRPSRGSSTPSSPSPVRCSSSSKCTVDKAHFDRLVSAPSRLQSQVNVVPAIRNDVFSGYKLKSVRAGSDAARLGFRAGDKITHVNGRDLTNDSEALQLYLSLGASRVFKIRYERSGRRLVKTVTVV